MPPRLRALASDDVLAIVDAIDVPYKWAMLGREPLAHWSVGRVSLLGDACHPTLPFLAQGANMAIEDGMVLARCLDAYADIAEALRHYEARAAGSDVAHRAWIAGECVALS